jgi:hypothetical protein
LRPQSGATPEYPAAVPMLAVMGGIFRTFDRYGIRLEAGDHNLVCDADSSAVSLNAAFRSSTCRSTSPSVVLAPPHLERLRAGDDLCRALADLCDVWGR